MTVIDDAIGMEERALTYYQEAAERVTDPSAKEILYLLAKEEKQHAEALKKMKTGEYGEFVSSSLLSAVRSLVEGALKDGEDTISSDGSLREILQKAMETEQATKRFYEEKGESASDPKVKELFATLTKQELEHYLIVSSLAEYFDRPAEWVESAEFGLRPEY